MFTIRKNNPFRKYFILSGVICGIITGLLFWGANYTEIKNIQGENSQKLAEIMLSDFDAQIQIMEEISLRISVDDRYQIRKLKRNKYNEIVLLEDFLLYERYSPLTREYFLYYGDSTIFHSSGCTKSLNYYFREKLDGESTQIMELLTRMTEEGNTALRERRMLEVQGDIYVLFSFPVLAQSGRDRAVLVYVIEREELESRFQLVSNGAKGTIALYDGETLLYCNREQACRKDQKGVLFSALAGSTYSLCYLPEQDDSIFSFFILQYFMLFLFILLLIYVIGIVLAEKSYQPIVRVTDKYQSFFPVMDRFQHRNAVESIDYMMENVLQRNSMMITENSKNRRMLKNQILQMLLDGSSFAVEPYLHSLQICLPGPCYAVMSFFFQEGEGLEEQFFYGLQEEVERLSCSEENEFVYVAVYYEKNSIHCIYSFEDEMLKEEMREKIERLIGEKKQKVLSGCGNTYVELSRLPASYLESMDIIQKRGNGSQYKEESEFCYDQQSLWRISRALSEGKEADALEALDCFLERTRDGEVSMLMQQYIYASFLSEISSQAAECQIELSQQSISLIVTAKNVKSFYAAASDLIHEFIEAVAASKKQAETKMAYRVMEYIKDHFTEYDLSIEKTAEDLNISKDAVRTMIYGQTGMMYKDYLVNLRIEYAKILLLQENMAVEDVCRKVGYSSVSYFTRLFKKKTGETPAKYRQ